MPSLAEFQREFADALCGSTNHQVQSPGLQVHRNTSARGLVEALLANYPTLEVLMGREWLARMADGYARRHPSRRAVLADYGDAFPDFLDAEAAAQWPYLPEVARLDRAWTRAFFASDARCLTVDRLQDSQPDLGSLRLTLHPSATFGTYGHSAVTVWRANRPPATPPAELCIDDRPESALVLRNHDGIVLLPQDAAGTAFLQAVVDGRDVMAAATDALQFAAQGDVATLWSTLLSQGAFADIHDHGD